MAEKKSEGMSGLLLGIKGYLMQMKEEGAKEVYLSPEGREALERMIRRVPGRMTLRELEEMMKKCHKCPIGGDRLNLVFGEGSEKADIVFVGEAPGEDEDEQGRPFVGRAGQLLTKIVKAMGYEREDVYIANVLKCRPPGNREPLPEEIQRCSPYLAMQVELIKPKAVVALGKHAAHALLGIETPITKLRGNLKSYRGIPVMPTFHPSYLLRNPRAKKEVWEDMKRVLEIVKRGRK